MVKSLYLSNNIFINVWNCRVVISRFEETPGGNLTWTSALNWEELEDEAVEAIEEQGGALNISGHYSCPGDLAAKAIFKDQVMWLCDLARVTGIPHCTLRLALNEGRLEGRKEGGRWRSSAQAVNEAIAAGRMRRRKEDESNGHL